MFCQIATKATAGRASDGSVSHSILTPSTWFNAPAEGWKIHFHTTPSARGALTQGITTTTRTRAEPGTARTSWVASPSPSASRSEEHTSELQSRGHLVCRLLLEKKKRK